MTRVTNFGRKRTYLEAGFGTTGEDSATQLEVLEDSNAPERAGGGPIDATGIDSEPPKKKKRIRKKKPKVNQTQTISGKEGGDAPAEGDGGEHGVEEKASGQSKKALKKKKWKEIEREKKQRRLLLSEIRRQKRIQERTADITCFACRGKGHAAKDCPNVKSGSVDGGTDKGKGKSLVGICYRCGSMRHTLSRCRKTIDESNPLPFALCFVCNRKGHLVSACPDNADKGIYPNGGCCKLCGEKTHLAKDCDLRKKDNVDTLVVMGSRDQPGADEDDFHTFKRRKQEVEKETKSEDAKKKTLQLKTGAQSGIVKSFGATSKPAKKVVYF